MYWPVVVQEEGFQVGKMRQGVRAQLLDGVVTQVPVVMIVMWYFVIKIVVVIVMQHHVVVAIVM